jgi:transcriptional regulator with XRE-family HTH domain
MSYRLTLSDRIRSARRLSALSRKQVASALNVSESAVAQWEHPDGTHPTLDKLARFASVAMVSFEWLATGAGEPARQLDKAPCTLEVFAQDADEEFLLLAWRRSPPKLRRAMRALIGAAVGLDEPASPGSFASDPLSSHMEIRFSDSDASEDA